VDLLARQLILGPTQLVYPYHVSVMFQLSYTRTETNQDLQKMQCNGRHVILD